jgi:phospholipid-binding lipoprotein MlaA
MLMVLVGCAEVPTNPEDRAEFEAINDPLEPLNRGVFDVNLALDRAVLKPVARGYRDWVPVAMRDRVHDFILNLTGPIVFVNDVLQGEPDRAAQTLDRFIINSTAGLLGLVDVVGRTGGPRHHEEDFGQTLAVWGVGEGPYLMLPFFGPSNPRDAVGRGVEWVADPADIALGNAFSREVLWGHLGTEMLDTRTELLDPLDELERSSLDFYAAVRSTYRQRRASLIINRDRPVAELVK